MAKRRGRWALILLVLLVVAAAIIFFLWSKKKKISMGLAEQIPDTEWIARVNVLSFLNQDIPKVKPDTSLRKLNLRKWDQLLSNPFKTGIDFFSDPWLFGNDSNTNALFHLGDAKQFKAWLQSDVEAIKNIDSGTTDLYEWMHITHDKVMLAWNAEGKLLVTLTRSSNPQTEAKRYFGNETARKSTEIPGHGKGVLRIQVYPESFPSRLNWLKGYLAEGTYDVIMEKDGIRVNEELWEQENSYPMLINLNRTGFTHQQFWAVEEINTLFGQQAGVNMQDVSNDTVSRFRLAYYGLDTQVNYHVSYQYDDNFNKVEIRDSSHYYVPMWDMRIAAAKQGLENVPDKIERGEGVMRWELQKNQELVQIRSSAAVKRQSENKSVANLKWPDRKDVNEVYLKWATIQEQRKNLPIALPVSGYSFIDEIVYQSDGKKVYFRLFFAD